MAIRKAQSVTEGDRPGIRVCIFSRRAKRLGDDSSPSSGSQFWVQLKFYWSLARSRGLRSSRHLAGGMNLRETPSWRVSINGSWEGNRRPLEFWQFRGRVYFPNSLRTIWLYPWLINVRLDKPQRLMKWVLSSQSLDTCTKKGPQVHTNPKSHLIFFVGNTIP